VRLIEDILGLPPKPAPAEAGAPDSASLRVDDTLLRRYLLVALLAGAVPLGVGVWGFGPRPLGFLALALATARLVEVVTARCRRKRSRGGALTFALLLVLVLPMAAPWWMVVVAAGFGALIGKEVFGGTGHQVFHPVLVGQAFILLSWPTLATGASISAIDAEATLECFGAALPAQVVMAGALALGGVALVLARAVDWRVPLATIAAGCLGVVAIRLTGAADAPDLPSLLLGDGFLCGALLLAGDPVTSPRTRRGRWIFGILVGLLAAMLRSFTANPGTIVYAILLGNMATPTIDALTAKAPEQEANA
jgi:H+/Na+-translocating ferredoxin:NAD+ oxidoreductase subunit D